jgi:hypothetical protein
MRVKPPSFSFDALIRSNIDLFILVPFVFIPSIGRIGGLGVVREAALLLGK